MEYILNSYEPKAIFHYFEDISRIPRGSGNEKAIAEFICNFARERGLRYYTDDHFNVAVYKDTTAGMEDLPPVMLQGHTDMVCEKNADTEHDFLKDPIKLIEKDGWLMADGTTLGGMVADEDEELRSFDRLTLRAAIDGLPENWRKLIVLRYFRDLSQTETAKLMGLTQVKVSREEKKIIEALRRALE